MRPFATLERASRIASVAILAALTCVAVTAEAASGLHSHEAGEVGLYNQECHLASLATQRSGAVLSAPASTAPVAVPLFAVAPTAVWRPARLLSSRADVRAPPTR